MPVSPLRDGIPIAEHCPTPWEVVEATEHHGPYIISEFGSTIADLYCMSRPDLPSTRNGGISYPIPHMADMAGPNAAFIVRAVNSHQILVDELQALVTAVRFADPPKTFNGVECHEARVPVAFIKGAEAALALALHKGAAS